MSDNIVICNENCSAGCNHCLYSMECMVRDDAFPESLYTINDIKSDFIILSGGEPLELDNDLLHKYTCMCLICKKYFRIATGGHIYIQPYLKLLNGSGRVCCGCTVRDQSLKLRGEISSLPLNLRARRLYVQLQIKGR